MVPIHHPEVFLIILLFLEKLRVLMKKSLMILSFPYQVFISQDFQRQRRGLLIHGFTRRNLMQNKGRHIRDVLGQKKRAETPFIIGFDLLFCVLAV